MINPKSIFLLQFLKTFEPPNTRLTNGHSMTSDALSNSHHHSSKTAISSKHAKHNKRKRLISGNCDVNEVGIELISKAENNYTSKSSLLLTTITTSSVLSKSIYLPEKYRRKAEKGNSLLEVVPQPKLQGISYCRQYHQKFEKLNREFEKIFDGMLCREKHFDPLQKYIKQPRFSDIVNLFIDKPGNEEDSEKELMEPERRTSSRVKRNQSIDDAAFSHAPTTISPNKSIIKRKKEPEFISASPTPVKLINGFKIPRLNGSLHGKSPIPSSVASSQDSSPSSSPSRNSNPPSPTMALYQELFASSAPLTRRQNKNLQDTSRAISKDLEVQSKGKRVPYCSRQNSSSSIKQHPIACSIASDIAASTSVDDHRYQLMVQQLNKNIKTSYKMISLLNDHVYLYSPLCLSDCTRGSVATTGLESLKHKNFTSTSSSSSQLESIQKRSTRKCRSSNSTCTYGSMAAPPLPPPLPTVTTRNRKRSNVDSLDILPETQPTLSRSQSIQSDVFESDAECNELNSNQSQKSRRVQYSEYEDEYGFNLSSYVEPPALSYEAFNHRSRNYAHLMEQWMSKELESETLNESRDNIKKKAPSKAICLVDGTINKLKAKSMFCFSHLADDPNLLKHDPFGLLDDSKVIDTSSSNNIYMRRFSSSSSSIDEPGSDEVFSAEEHEQDQESKPPKDEVTSTIEFLNNELAIIGDNNHRLISHVSDCVLHEMKTQEMITTSYKKHVDVMHNMRLYLQKVGIVPQRDQAALVKEIDDLILSKEQIDVEVGKMQVKADTCKTFDLKKKLLGVNGNSLTLQDIADGRLMEKLGEECD